MIPALVVAAVAVVIIVVLAAELAKAIRWGRAVAARSENLTAELDAARAAATTLGDDPGASTGGPPPAVEPGLPGGPAAGATDAALGPLLSAARGTLDALWQLAQLELERDRQVADAISTAPGAATPVRGLLSSLAEEVGRVREETGTPGTLHTAVELEPSAGVAVVMLRGVQALLAAIGRHCQAYDLTVYPVEGRLIAQVVCDGFDGPDSVGADASAVLAAVRPAGGEVALDRDEQGRLRAHLSIPTVVG